MLWKKKNSGLCYCSLKQINPLTFCIGRRCVLAHFGKNTLALLVRVAKWTSSFWAFRKYLDLIQNLNTCSRFE